MSIDHERDQLMSDLKEEVITYAIDYINAIDYGPSMSNVKKALKDLRGAVKLYEVEIVD